MCFTASACIDVLGGGSFFGVGPSSWPQYGRTPTSYSYAKREERGTLQRESRRHNALKMLACIGDAGVNTDGLTAW